MTVGDSTIQAAGLGDFFRNLGKKGFEASKKKAKKCLGKSWESFRNWC